MGHSVLLLQQSPLYRNTSQCACKKVEKAVGESNETMDKVTALDLIKHVSKLEDAWTF